MKCSFQIKLLTQLCEEVLILFSYLLPFRLFLTLYSLRSETLALKMACYAVFNHYNMVFNSFHELI